MAMALDIMKGGVSALQARGINGQVTPTATAAGTTQTDALAITASITVITTAAAASGVRLPACEIGDEIDICNLGANAATVYPDVGARVNALSTNAGFLLATNTSCKLKRFTTTRWLGNLSA